MTGCTTKILNANADGAGEIEIVDKE